MDVVKDEHEGNTTIKNGIQQGINDNTPPQ